jgi:hypothetical protein
MSSADQQARLRQPGHHEVESSVMCSLTRFGLRSGRHLPPTYRDYRRVMREVDKTTIPGLLCNAFLVENPTTCYSLSIWSGPPRLSAFVPRHVEVAGAVFGRLAFDPERGPELWSTSWSLNGVTNNLNWAGVDLRETIAGSA